MNTFIYMIVNLVNGKIYIGKSYKPLERFKAHKYLAQSGKSDTYLQRAIRKYGSDNFELRIIDGPFTDNIANDMEKRYIELFNTYRNGYNMTLGGDGGVTWTKETHPNTYEKVRKQRIGRKCSDETKRKIGEANRGENNGMYGRTGKNHHNYGKKASLELRKKLSLAHIGKSSHSGWHHSAAAKEKIRQAKLGKKHPTKKGKAVICVETNTIYASIVSAKKATGINNIGCVCNGVYKTAGGYHWRFV